MLGGGCPKAPSLKLHLSARRLGRASVLGPGRAENLITKSYHLSYCSIKLTVTPPYPPHGGTPGPGPWENFNNIFPCCDFLGILVAFIFSSFFRCFFSSILVRFSFPTCLSKTTKIHQHRQNIDAKMSSHVEVVVSSIFDKFLLQFWTTRIQNLLKFHWKNIYFLGFRPFQLNLTTMRFRCPACLHFGAKLVPKI